MIDPGETLGAAAQVAVALAGFAGAVVSFRPGSMQSWSAVDRFRLRLLLGNSVLPLFLCLMGMLLLAITPFAGAVAWVFTFLQVYNAIFLGAFWPFFAMIAFQLVAAVIQFIRLILLSHEGG